MPGNNEDSGASEALGEGQPGSPDPQRSPAPRRVHIKTFGCQMNVYDSERMSEALGASGYAPTDAPEDADLVILNTCHIREKAAEKVYSELGRVRAGKLRRMRAGLDTVVAVAGCVAQAEGAEIIRRAPVVDLVVGPQSYHRLPALLARIEAGTSGIVETDFPEEDKFDHLPGRGIAPGVRRQPTAFLTVQEGCDKFCTFCVVPYTRGAELSRPAVALIEEARRLVAQGVREITLLGQNVNAYHGAGLDGKNWSLARLIGDLALIEGLDRLRYTTSHPRDMSDDLIEAHALEPKLMPYLHLPFQAGADRVLAAMNRKHTAAEYLALVARLRTARPDLALSTDIIVGFPGETEPEFEATLAIVREVGFAHAFSFKYSPRPGTPASTMDGQVPDAMKSERLARLQALLDEQQAAFAGKLVGRTVPVLFERAGRNPGQLVGRSPYLQPVHAEAGPEWLGRIAPTEIVTAGPNSLAGVILPA
jgi:tRNA-2-methylthio-N6-dimethylallyladenosine synthase